MNSDQDYEDAVRQLSAGNAKNLFSFGLFCGAIGLFCFVLTRVILTIPFWVNSLMGVN